MGQTQEVTQQSVAPYNLIKAHIFFGTALIFVVVLAGLAYAMQFINMYPLQGIEFFSPARVRMVHTQAVAYGWLANVFFGIVLWMIPKLTNRKILSEKLGWFVFYAYNFLVLTAVVMILGGKAQALEWGETPMVVDIFLALVVVLYVINVVTPIWQARFEPYYVTIWYVLAALIWTPLVFVMGNFHELYFG